MILWCGLEHAHRARTQPSPIIKYIIFIMSWDAPHRFSIENIVWRIWGEFHMVIYIKLISVPFFSIPYRATQFFVDTEDIGENILKDSFDKLIMIYIFETI